MRTILLLPVMALIGASSPTHLHAQVTPDSARRAPSSRGWTAQEISDACQHKPGARMRLYGCKPEAYLPRGGEPLIIVDSEALPTDTAGPGRSAREAALRVLDPKDIEELTPIHPDSAVARFGVAARYGAILIRTRHPKPRPTDMKTPPAQRAGDTLGRSKP